MKKQAIAVMNGNRQGRIRKFNSVSEDKIKKMMELEYQGKSEAKIKWAVNAYRDWRNMRLDSKNYDEEIMYTDLDDIGSLTKENLEFSLCRFICEVKKHKEDKDYPGHTLYQMTCALQIHLRKKILNWKLVHGDEFINCNCVLDKVMQEQASLSLGTVKCQAEVISLEFEQKLWNDGILGWIVLINYVVPCFIYLE